MKSPRKFGKSYSQERVSLPKRWNLLPKNKEVRLVCRMGGFSTTMRKKIGGRARVYRKTCLRESQVGRIRRFFMNFLLLCMTRNLARIVTQTAIAGGIWRLATPFSWSTAKPPQVYLKNFHRKMWIL